MSNSTAAWAFESLGRGDFSVAAAAISTLPTGDVSRYVLTALAMHRAGNHAQAQSILRQLNFQSVERFVADTVEHIDKASADALLEHCFSETPTPRERAPSISIFSFPKSGSTFLESVLADYTGMSAASMTSHNDLHGASLDTLVFERAIRQRQIARGHLAADARCITRCVAYDLQPVFLHRNIFDSLLSFADHFRQKYRPFPYEVPDSETAFDAAVLRMAFHYVEMFASWTHFARRWDRILTLSYEDNRHDWAEAARRVLEHSGIAVDRRRLDEAVARSNEAVVRDPHSVRYRRGGKRDRTGIDEEIVGRIRRLYRMFPDVDFTPIDDGAGRA